MKHTLIVGTVGSLLLASGCQSLNWTAKNKSSSGEAVAQNAVVREVPWTWRKGKSTPNSKSDLPPEIQAKFDQAKDRAGATKSAAQWYAEGSQHELAGNFAAATKAYESAISVDPLSAEAHHRLGIMSDMRQEYGTAEDHYKAALRQKPHDANILSDFGYSNSLRGNVQQSERYLLQALDLDSQHKHALKNLGSLYASQGRYDDALLAFRRLRPEAEAQQLMTQFFPKGRPIPDGDNAQLASAKNANGSRTVLPAASDKFDPAALKNLSPEEIKELMEQRRDEAVKQREQRDVANSRPNLQQSITQDEWARLPSGPIVSPGPPNAAKDVPHSAEWAPNPPPVASVRGLPPNVEPSGQPPMNMNRGGFAGASDPSMSYNLPTASTNPSAPGSMPIWNGAPLASGTRPDNGPSGRAGNSWPDASNAAGSVATSQQPPPWWNEDGAGRAPFAGVEARDFDPQRPPAVATAPPPSWGGTSNFVAGNVATARTNPSLELTARQRAYQLGMSAGPGTMFPAMPAETISNVTNHQPAGMPAATPPGVQWSNSMTPGGYNQSQAVGSADHPGNPTDALNWQMAPVDVAPRSPTENWGSPSSIPWPGRGEATPSHRETTGTQPSTPAMPVIAPRSTPWDNTEPPQSNQPQNAGATEPPNGPRDVVPAWHYSASPAPRQARPRNTTPVPQWPYAPN